MGITRIMAGITPKMKLSCSHLNGDSLFFITSKPCPNKARVITHETTAYRSSPHPPVAGLRRGLGRSSVAACPVAPARSGPAASGEVVHGGVKVGCRL